MSVTRLRPALVLSTWTLLVWTTRIRNIWTNDSLDTGGQIWRTALAVTFTAFAAVTLVLWWQGRRRGGAVARWATTWVRAFAIWTVGVWIVRGSQIAFGDHSAAFIAVHTVLAVVSIGLAVWADRAAHGIATRRSSLPR